MKKITISKPSPLVIIISALAMAPWLAGFILNECNNVFAFLSGVIAVLELIALIYLILKKQGGGWLVALALCLAAIGSFALISFC